jgi:diguanylate cyclase (GGDEF)-like protein
VAQIGLKNLLPLVLGVSFAGIFNKLTLPLEDRQMLWKASLLKAVTASVCVRQLGGRFASTEEREGAAEEAFLAGLLQDFAIPVFNSADRSTWPEFLAAIDLPEKDRAEAESRLYGVDHTVVAGDCARLLGLPDLFIKLSQAHHGGVAALTDAGAGQIAVAVDAAASLPHRHGSLSAKLLQGLSLRLRMTANASEEQVVEVARQISEEFTRASALLAEPEDASASFKQFLHNLGAEVADCLQESILSAATEISGLKEKQRRIGDEMAALEEKTQRAEFDPLTQALTRAALLTKLSMLLPMARGHGAGCAVGYLDLDNFKQINDTHGHAAGDAALVATATMLRTVLRGNGICGRVGGDEFVFAMVGRLEGIDRAITEFINRMASVGFAWEGLALNISASIGVFLMGVPAVDADALAALKVADQLMYQAKRAGKGRGVVGSGGESTGTGEAAAIVATQHAA